MYILWAYCFQMRFFFYFSLLSACTPLSLSLSLVLASSLTIVPNVQSLKTKNYFSILLINFTYTQFVNYDLRRYRSTITFHHLLSAWVWVVLLPPLMMVLLLLDLFFFAFTFAFCFAIHIYIYSQPASQPANHSYSCASLRFFFLLVPVRLLFGCSNNPIKICLTQSARLFTII